MQARQVIAMIVACAAMVSAASADVFNMGGTRNTDGSWAGLASLETVRVGNPGNVADTRYDPNGFGGVDYEYDIGKYEVTAGQYATFLNAVAATDTYELYSPSMWSNIYGCKIERSGNPGGYTYAVAAEWANRPANFVSWGDAARFANWLQNGRPSGLQDATTTEDGTYCLDGAVSRTDLSQIHRRPGALYALPTENEWYKAAYGKASGVGYWDYPTGEDILPSNQLYDPDPGNNANAWQDDFTVGIPYFRTEVGEFENSSSPYGTFDQGGNVWEWNEATIGTSYRGLRGGSFSSGGTMSDLAASRRGYTTPTYESAAYGFRVAQVPEPATLTLLALGGLLVLTKRRPA